MILFRSREYYFATLVLAISSFLIFCNLYAVQPILSVFSEYYQVSISTANWIFAGGSLGLSCSLIPWALLSDRFGRRKIILISLLCSSLIAILMFFVDSVFAWILGRIIQGVALAGLPSVAVAYITEEFESKSIAGVVGTYIAANLLGGISGRLIGGVLAEYFGLNAPMLFCGIVTFIGVVIAWFYLPTERYFKSHPLTITTLIANLCSNIRNLVIFPTFCIGAVCFGVFVNLFTVIGLRLQHAPWNLSTTQISLLFLCYLSGTLSASLTGKLTRRFSPLRGMFYGWAVLVIGVLLLFSTWLSLMIVGLLVCSIGFFTTHALASGWVSRKATQARALASALYLSFYYLGASFIGFYIIPLWRNYGWNLMIIGVLALLLVIPIMLFFIHKYEKLSNNNPK
ncbi:MFS transporter [Mergibacter septicus]|uniref:MFS transporter n=1 Tax=Mergibacter septicus TaxID=221402 RepID=UPI00117952D1|nr:MFS transporter [Mergibacter septicus]AWX14552.1 MFS transporter [Mergibacter septicus]